jgi:acetyl esterase/lipase
MTKPLPKIPSELRTLMAEIGRRWVIKRADNIETMIARFSEVLKTAPKDGIGIRRDITYGAHPRQRIDIYTPGDGRTEHPALLFVHGGAFMDGHRNRTPEIYSNVSCYFARNGIVGMNIGYRLGGDTPYPGATKDIASVVQWTRTHAREIRVDPSRIFLMGHSAGGAHAGSYAYDKRRQPIGGPGLAGLIVVSGRVRAENRPENPNAAKVVAYYGTDDAQRLDDLSPVSHVSADSIPTLIAWGEYENPLIDLHCAELAYRLAAAKKRSPPVVWLRGHNHTSTIAHINTADEGLGRAMVDFIVDPR